MKDMKLIDNVANKITRDIAIDLGTANIRIVLKEGGRVIIEPSIVAINQSTGKILAVGEEAKRMIGRTPANIIAVQPLKNGVISDFNATEALISNYIKKVRPSMGTLSKFLWLNAIIAVPSLITEVEIKAVIDSAKSAGAKKVYIVEEPVAAAIGSGIKIEEASGSMIVDIGGGTSDIAVISLGGIVVDNTIKVAGDSMDTAIQDYVRKKYNLLIGIKMAEELKIKIGNAIPPKSSEKMGVKGQDIITGLPKSLEIDSLEVTEALNPILNKILSAMKEAIEKSPPEIISDLINNGVHITGGGALIKNIDKYFAKDLGIKVIIPKDPIFSVANGLKLMLEDSSLLHRMQFKDFILR
jgi:rod shape-determining protein MreB